MSALRPIQSVPTVRVNTLLLWCCSSGVGRTGALCLLYAALQELEAGNGIPELPLLVKKMRRQRKNMLQEKVGWWVGWRSSWIPLMPTGKG